jgi:hypothetical protein
MNVASMYAPRVTPAKSVKSVLNDPAVLQDLPRFAACDERTAHYSSTVDRLAELASMREIDAFLADRDARMPR